MGKGAFQELDQLAAVAEHVKWAGQAARLEDIPRVLADAFQAGATASQCNACLVPLSVLGLSLLWYVGYAWIAHAGWQRHGSVMVPGSGNPWAS